MVSLRLVGRGISASRRHVVIVRRPVNARERGCCLEHVLNQFLETPKTAYYASGIQVLRTFKSVDMFHPTLSFEIDGLGFRVQGQGVR